MLEEKLKLARAKNQQKRRNYLIFFLVALLISAALIVGVTYLDFQTDKTPTEVKSEYPPSNPPATTSSQEDREKFLSLLGEYETEIEPEINQSNLGAWNNESLEIISELKSDAVSQFGQAEYQQAISNIESLMSKSKAVIAERDALFNDAFNNAGLAYADDSYVEARKNIDKALIYKPFSPEVRQLDDEISQLGDIVPLLEQIRIAKSENNIDKEHKALSEILKINPDRSEDKARFEELTRQIINRSFNNQLSKANQQLEISNASAARNHYLQAKKIDSSRSELKLFEGKLLALEKNIRVSNLLDNARDAVRNDDWLSAKSYLEKGRQESPQNKEILDTLEIADQVISSKGQVNRYLSNPYQLSGENSQVQARAVIDAASKLTQYSYSLKNDISSLSTLLTKMNKEVAVEINSDNKTNILVRGVGKVGQTDKRTIYLKPGEYTFEGLRKGYRSELIKTLIPYDEGLVKITIICDEPI